MIMITSMMHFCKGVLLMNDITVQEAYNQFILQGSTYWALTTKKYYERNVTYFLLYLEKHLNRPVEFIPLSELPASVLSDYTLWLRSKDKFDDHPLRDKMNVNGTIKNNTVNTYMRAVKAFFNYLYQAHYTKVRYTEGVKLPKSDDDQIIPLLASDVYKIDSVFDRELPNDPRNLCIIHLMLDAGLRSCEVISLEASDIIFASRTIVINRSKGKKSRVVIMCPLLEQLLGEYCQLFHGSGRLFKKTTENKGISESVIKALFLRIVRNTGIDRIHPHLLRHTFATSYIMGGGNLETLRILMGHSDYSVTRMYLHLAAQYQIMDTDIYRLDPVFFKKAY